MNTYSVVERTTRVYTATIKDELGVAIPAASLTTLKLTLYERHTGQILNSRDEQSILNANNVTVDASGVLTWTMQPADNAHMGVERVETHIALFEWTYAAGAKSGKHEVAFTVENLSQVA